MAKKLALHDVQFVQVRTSEKGARPWIHENLDIKCSDEVIDGLLTAGTLIERG
jgi:hypothetical protein